MTTREEVEVWLLSHGYKKDPRSLECVGIFQYGETEWYCNTRGEYASFWCDKQGIVPMFAAYKDLVVSGEFLVWTIILSPGFPGVS